MKYVSVRRSDVYYTGVYWCLDIWHCQTGYRHYGLELVDGKVRDNLACGVVEPAISKIKSLRFATEAAITILRIGEDY